jgi:hypothetical protein
MPETFQSKTTYGNSRIIPGPRKKYRPHTESIARLPNLKTVNSGFWFVKVFLQHNADTSKQAVESGVTSARIVLGCL